MAFAVKNRVLVSGLTEHDESGEGIIIRVRLGATFSLYDVRLDNGRVVQAVWEDRLTLIGKQEVKQFCRVGDVLMCEQGLGIVRYVGPVENDEEIWPTNTGLGCFIDRIGVELKDSSKKRPKGTHNGTWMKKYYYTCPENTGLFIREEDIMKLISAEEILHRCAQMNTEIIELDEKIKQAKAKLNE
jgi:hypothetical protein